MRVVASPTAEVNGRKTQRRGSTTLVVALELRLVPGGWREPTLTAGQGEGVGFKEWPAGGNHTQRPSQGRTELGEAAVARQRPRTLE